MADPKTPSMTLDLAPLHLPDAPSAWPLAWGWWCLIALTILAVVAIVYALKQKRNKNKLKNLALNELSTARTPDALQAILKRFCLSYYPREQVAGLTGQAWTQFLDKHANVSPSFSQNQSDWDKALYQGQAVAEAELKVFQHQCQTWIKQAAPQLIKHQRQVKNHNAKQTLTGGQDV